MEIFVSIETHYGAKRIYPECAKSRTFAEIANKDTLPEYVCEHIEELGYTITVKTPSWKD
jgi:hypothetical protein